MNNSVKSGILLLTAAMIVSLAGCAKGTDSQNQPVLSSEDETTVTTEVSTTERITTTQTTTKRTNTTTKSTTTTTETTEAVSFKFDDLSNADMLITNGDIYPYYYEPSAEVRQTIADALLNADLSVYDFGSSDNFDKYEALGIVSIRNNDDYFFFQLFRDSHIMVKKQEEGIAADYYKISYDSAKALYKSFFSNEENGNELKLYGGDIYYKNFWDTAWTNEANPENTAPCGDISNAYVCMTDTAITPSVYVLTDFQKKILSDYLNTGEWGELPEDAQPSLYGNTNAPTVYINNNGNCSSLYLDINYVSYYDGSVRKYQDPGHAYSIAAYIMDSVLMDLGRARIVGTNLHTHPEEERTTDVIWDEIWGAVIPSIEEKTPKWNSRELPD